jgi:hypothetical protein
MSGNPNGPSIEEVDEWRQIEADKHDRWMERQIATHWLVIRGYRGKMRVISMHTTLHAAEIRYAKERENLRDGDLYLTCTNFRTIEIASGGYNRTRW